jgi:hypothetical protein
VTRPFALTIATHAAARAIAGPEQTLASMCTGISCQPAAPFAVAIAVIQALCSGQTSSAFRCTLWLMPRLLEAGVIVAALVLSACGGGRAPTVWYKIVTAPNGFPAAWITCKGNQGDCYQLAGSICKYGYDVLRDDGSSVGADERAYEQRGEVRVESQRRYEGNLFVQCKAPAPYHAVR